jgi:hypothetical protein
VRRGGKSARSGAPVEGLQQYAQGNAAGKGGEGSTVRRAAEGLQEQAIQGLAGTVGDHLWRGAGRFHPQAADAEAFEGCPGKPAAGGLERAGRG